MKTWLAACCVLALLAGCGDDTAKNGGGNGAAPASGPTALQTPDGWPSPDERRLDPNHMPTPFSVEQVRAGCGPESKRVYRMEPKEGGLDYILYTFREVTSKGCIAEQARCDADGNVTGETRGGPATWIDLQRHSSFPADSTTISEADIKVPAGKFACMQYVVLRRGAKGAGLDKFWFAWDLPGPPVRLERYVNGELNFTMTLMKAEGVRTE